MSKKHWHHLPFRWGRIWKCKVALSVILAMFLAACGHTVYVPVVTSPDCRVPERQVYTQLNPAEHIASRNNIERLMLIISDMSAYTKRLESSLRCFGGSEAAQATETK